jgi:CheY-like chemotaxis protein
MKTQILVVEDEMIVIEMLKTTLQSAGYEISAIVDSGESTIEKAESDHKHQMEQLWIGLLNF